jgi:cytochrome b subunit of formate dehydrogenase
MKANKLYPYFIAVNLLMLLLSGATDPIIGGLAFLIAMILLSGTFSILCKGWRRFFAICFIVLGILMSFRVVHLQRIFDERMERVLKASDNFARTNSPPALSETNSNI